MTRQSLLALSVGLLACSATPAAQTVQVDGEIRSTCAPWDGPALRVTLHGREGATLPAEASLSLYLYRHGGEQSGRFTLGGSDSEGSAEWCPAVGNCQTLHSGEVRLAPSDGTTPREGSYWLTLPSGEQVRGSFLASWVEPEGPCG